MSDYLWVLGTIVFVLLLNKVISKYIALLLCKIFKRAWKTFDQQKFIDLIIHPLGTFLVITVSIIALYRLEFPDQLNVNLYKYTIQRVLLSVAISIQVIALTWLILRVTDFIATVLSARAALNADHADHQLIVFFRDFLKVIIGVIGGVLLLHFAFDYNVSSLLTGLSIVGAAIALALRESLENLIASFVIFFDKPFTTGDLVKVQAITGNVERIGLRSTRIRTTDKSYVTVPNKQMVDSILDNLSLRSQLRGELILQIHHETPQGKVQELLQLVKTFISGIPELQNYNVLFNDIRQHSFVITIEYFTPPMDNNHFLGIKQSINFFVLQTMESLDIKLAGKKEDA